MAPPPGGLSKNAVEIVRPAFLERATDQASPTEPANQLVVVGRETLSVLLSLTHDLSQQKDLIRRLRQLVHVLRVDTTIEANHPTAWPGLAALTQVCALLLRHKDKLVRLHATVSCMELFFIVSEKECGGVDCVCSKERERLVGLGPFPRQSTRRTKYTIY